MKNFKQPVLSFMDLYVGPSVLLQTWQPIDMPIVDHAAIKAHHANYPTPDQMIEQPECSNFAKKEPKA